VNRPQAALVRGLINSSTFCLKIIFLCRGAFGFFLLLGGVQDGWLNPTFSFSFDLVSE